MASKEQTPTKKWSNEQIIALIEAYKEELCLYATNTPYYHNKHMRSEALKRVGNAVRILRPDVSEKECSTKFHTLRTQYNIKRNKVKASIKSGTGTENIYKPSLWYYEHLSFPESFFTPRKSRNSAEPSSGVEDFRSSQIFTSGCFSEDGRLSVIYEEDVEDIGNSVPDTSMTEDLFSSQTGSDESTSSLMTMNASSSTSLASTSTVVRPSSSPSPALSVSPALGGSRNEKRKADVSDDYSQAIAALAESIRQPIVVANPPPTAVSQSGDDGLNGFLSFLGSIIQRIQNEELRLDVMRMLMETAINARSVDIERSRWS